MPIPLAVGALAAGASVGGGLLRNKHQREMAREQMAFQERMSSTSYQRAVKDMRLAGINPMLAYQQGGASSPGGAQAQISDVVGPAVSSAMQARRLTQELKNMEATQQTTIEAGKREQSQYQLNYANRDLATKSWWLRDAQQKHTLEMERYQRMQTNLLRMDEPLRRADRDFYNTKAGRIARWAELAQKSIFGGGGVSGLVTRRLAPSSRSSRGGPGAGPLPLPKFKVPLPKLPRRRR